MQSATSLLDAGFVCSWCCLHGFLFASGPLLNEPLVCILIDGNGRQVVVLRSDEMLLKMRLVQVRTDDVQTHVFLIEILEPLIAAVLGYGPSLLGSLVDVLEELFLGIGGEVDKNRLHTLLLAHLNSHFSVLVFAGLGHDFLQIIRHLNLRIVFIIAFAFLGIGQETWWSIFGIVGIVIAIILIVTVQNLPLISGIRVYSSIHSLAACAS